MLEVINHQGTEINFDFFFMLGVSALAPSAKTTKGTMQTKFNSEKELEDFLSSSKNLKKYLGLKFISRQVRIGSFPTIGILDILAIHEPSKTLYLIEIVKGSIGSSDLIQSISYLNYVNLIPDKNIKYKNVKILLLGRDLDKKIIKCVRKFNPENCSYQIEYALLNNNWNKLSFGFDSSQVTFYENKLEAVIHE